jgi:hypothetical protein
LLSFQLDKEVALAALRSDDPVHKLLSALQDKNGLNLDYCSITLKEWQIVVSVIKVSILSCMMPLLNIWPCFPASKQQTHQSQHGEQ